MNATERARRSDAYFKDNISRRGLCDRIALLESELETATASNIDLLTIDPKARYYIVVYVLRYVLGRKTFAPHTFIEWITPQIGKLKPNTCALMVRDIHEWAEMVGRTEVLRGWYSEHDLTQWEPLLERLEKRAAEQNA